MFNAVRRLKAAMDDNPLVVLAVMALILYGMYVAFTTYQDAEKQNNRSCFELPGSNSFTITPSVPFGEVPDPEPFGVRHRDDC
jgi:hypothetical protein